MRVVVNDGRVPRWPVDRRAVAAVAFALALISVLTFPGVVGRNTEGAAVVGTVPDAPRLGDCLAPLTTPRQLASMTDAVGVVPCSEPHSAELILTGRLDTDTYPGASPAAADALIDIDRQCQDAVTRYVSGVRPNGPLGRLDPRARARVTVPSTVQWAYGQRWYGCEVMPATDSYPISWTGTAHLAGLGAPPAVFATCAQGIGGQPVDCSRVHSAEQLTWNDRPADADTTGCYALAAAIMKTADPTYAGKLVVANRKVQAWTECWIATQGSAQLTGTLIGHGSGPLPLS
jgi:hypothetical protein